MTVLTEPAARALAQVVADLGPQVSTRPGQVRAALVDALAVQAPASRAQVDALVLASEEGIPSALAERSVTEPPVTSERPGGVLGPGPAVAAGRSDEDLVDRLRTRGLEDAAGRYAVAAWAAALSLPSTVSSTDLGAGVVTDLPERPGAHLGAPALPLEPTELPEPAVTGATGAARGGGTSSVPTRVGAAPTSGEAATVGTTSGLPWWRRHRGMLMGVGAVVALVLAVGGALFITVRTAPPVLRLAVDEVSVDKGVRIGDTFLGSSEKVLGIDVRLLDGPTRSTLSKGQEFADDAAVKSRLAELRAAMKIALPELTLTKAAWPQGNTVTVAWTAPDQRQPVVTTLSNGDGKPLPGCPTQISEAGTCTVTGEWTSEIRAQLRAGVTDSFISAATTSQAVTTDDAQALTLEYVGTHTFGDAGPSCAVKATIKGAQPSTSLPFTVDVVWNDGQPMSDDFGGATISIEADGSGSHILGWGEPGGEFYITTFTLHTAGMTATTEMAACQ